MRNRTFIRVIQTEKRTIFIYIFNGRVVKDRRHNRLTPMIKKNTNPYRSAIEEHSTHVVEGGEVEGELGAVA